MKFRVMAGLHQAADPDWEPSEEDLAQAKLTGRAPRAPTKTYKAGQIVESDTDLEARFGSEKFRALGERTKLKGKKPGQAEVPTFQPSFPGGQVAEGFQESHEGVSGPAGGEFVNVTVKDEDKDEDEDEE